MSKTLVKQVLLSALLMCAASANAALMRIDFAVQSYNGISFVNAGNGSLVYDTAKLTHPAPEANYYAKLESLDLNFVFGDVQTTFQKSDVTFYNIEISASNVVKDINFSGSNGDGATLGFGFSPLVGTVNIPDVGPRTVLYAVSGITELPPSAPVPEPATLGLFSLGLLGLVGLRRKQR
jgi:hypothetical protein